jgi:hypothetical protein
MLLFNISCGYKDIVKADNDFAKSMATVQTITMAAYNSQPQLLNRELKNNIIGVCLKVDIAGKQIHQVIVSTNKMSAEDRTKVLALTQTIINTLDPKELEFISGIKDEKTKSEIELGFTLARTAITTMRIILSK